MDATRDGFTDIANIAAVGISVIFMRNPPAGDRADLHGSGTVGVADIATIGDVVSFGAATGRCDCRTATPGMPGCPRSSGAPGFGCVFNSPAWGMRREPNPGIGAEGARFIPPGGAARPSGAFLNSGKR